MKVLQNVKLGFDNFKELFKIFLENTNDDGSYDIYINSEDAEIAGIAQELKNAEQNQNFSSDDGIIKKNSKAVKKISKTGSHSATRISKSRTKKVEKEEPEH